jgi:RND family efflux transporter MFP subunit
VLFTISGTGPMVVKAQVDEQDVINVMVGQRALISGEDFPGRTLTGIVTNVGAVVVAANQAGNSAKNVETTISLQQEYSFLRTGMSCDVDIVTGEARHALVVPLAAVMDVGDKHYVFVVSGKTVHKVEVHKGLASDTDVVITSGLRAGESIATTNVKDLTDGARVKPQPQASASPLSSP